MASSSVRYNLAKIDSLPYLSYRKHVCKINLARFLKMESFTYLLGFMSSNEQSILLCLLHVSSIIDERNKLILSSKVIEVSDEEDVSAFGSRTTTTTSCFYHCRTQ